MRVFQAQPWLGPLGYEPGKFYWTRGTQPNRTPESPPYPDGVTAFQSAVMNQPDDTHATRQQRRDT